MTAAARPSRWNGPRGTTDRARGLVASLVLASLAAGCSQITGQAIPADRQKPDAVFCVERHSRDGRNLAALIADELRARGYTATSGPAEQQPANCDLRVGYIDHWDWDVRMFLTDLRIDIYDARTGYFLGYGRSYQDSLSSLGKRYPHIVRRALHQALPRLR